MWRGRREEEEQDAGANQRVNLGGQSEQRWRAAAAAFGGQTKKRNKLLNKSNENKMLRVTGGAHTGTNDENKQSPSRQSHHKTMSTILAFHRHILIRHCECAGRLQDFDIVLAAVSEGNEVISSSSVYLWFLSQDYSSANANKAEVMTVAPADRSVSLTNYLISSHSEIYRCV